MNIKEMSHLSALRQAYRAGSASAAGAFAASQTSGASSSSSAPSDGVTMSSATVSLGADVLENLQGDGTSAASSSSTSPSSTSGAIPVASSEFVKGLNGRNTALIYGPADTLTDADKKMFHAITGLTIGEDDCLYNDQGQSADSQMTQNVKDLLAGMTLDRHVMQLNGQGEASFTAQQITDMMTRVMTPDGPVVVDRAMLQRALDYVASTPS